MVPGCGIAYVRLLKEESVEGAIRDLDGSEIPVGDQQRCLSAWAKYGAGRWLNGLESEIIFMYDIIPRILNILCVLYVDFICLEADDTPALNPLADSFHARIWRTVRTLCDYPCAHPSAHPPTLLTRLLARQVSDTEVCTLQLLRPPAIVGASGAGTFLGTSAGASAGASAHSSGGASATTVGGTDSGASSSVWARRP